jgi:hypothetical protein
MTFPIDVYTLKARIVPALIALDPLLAAGTAFVPITADWRVGGATAAALSVVGYLLGQLTRDAGKRLEPKLWAEWGGLPSIAMLRYRDARIDPVSKDRFHANLSKLVPGLNLPSSAQELAAPDAADQQYEGATSWLRTQTRDKKRFDLLFEENVAYGFRRNLLAIKPVVLVSCAVGAGVSSLPLVTEGMSSWIRGLGAVGLGVSLIVAAYMILVSRGSLLTQAENYARRLIEASDVLVQNAGPSTARKRQKVAPAET